MHAFGRMRYIQFERGNEMQTKSPGDCFSAIVGLGTIFILAVTAWTFALPRQTAQAMAPNQERCALLVPKPMKAPPCKTEDAAEVVGAAQRVKS